MADGKVIISTELDNSGIEKGVKETTGYLGGLKRVASNVGSVIKASFSELGAGSKEMESAVRDVANSVEGIGYKAKIALQKQVDAFAKQNALYAQQRQKVDELHKKLSELNGKKIETEAFKAVSAEVDQLNQKMNAIIDKQERFVSTGGNTSSRTFQQMDYDLEQVIQKLNAAKSEKQKLFESGKAYRAADTSAVDQQFTAECEKLRLMNSSLVTSFNALNAKIEEYGTKSEIGAKKTSQFRSELTGFSNVSASAAKEMAAVNSGASSISKNLSGGAGSILKYGLGIQSLYMLFGKLRSVIKVGFTNLARFDGSTNKSISALSSSLTQLKNSLATAFAPILNVVAPALTNFINLLSKAATSVGMFFAALSGKSTYTKAISVQNDYAESLKSTGKAAKSASKSLAGFDEITRLNSNDDSGGGGGANASDMFENSEVPSVFTNIVDKIKALFDPILQDFKDFGKQISESAKTWFSNLDFEPLKVSFLDLLASIEPLIDILLDGLSWAFENVLLPLSGWIIEDAVPVAINLFSDAANVLYEVLIALQPLGIWLWDNFLKPLAEWTGGIIVDVMNSLADALCKVSDWISQNEGIVQIIATIVGSFAAAWVLVNGAVAIWNVIAGVATAVTTAFGAAVAFLTSPIGIVILAIGAIIAIIALLAENWDAVKESALNVWEAIKSAWDTVATWFDENIIQPLSTFFSNMWTNIKTWAINAWSGIKSVFFTIGSWIKTNIIQPVGNFFSGLWSGFLEKARSAWEGVKTVFGKVASFFKDTFQKAWQGIVNVFSVAGEIFVNIKDGIVSAFKKVVNGIIGGINRVVSIPFNSINSALRTIKNINILGLTPFSGLRTISVPQIPYLAQGAVLPANKPFLAMVGDQKHGTNIEAPLETIQEAVALVMEDYISAVLAGDEAIVAVLREILQAVLGIEIGDDAIYRAVERHRRKINIARGGV